MSDLTAQVSLYPLGREALRPAVDAVLDVFRSYDLRVEPGAMSTIIAGDEADVFAALRAATHAATADGRAVLVMTISNACTLPDA